MGDSGANKPLPYENIEEEEGTGSSSVQLRFVPLAATKESEWTLPVIMGIYRSIKQTQFTYLQQNVKTKNDKDNGDLTDDPPLNIVHKGRELKDNTLINNARLLKKMNDAWKQYLRSKEIGKSVVTFTKDTRRRYNVVRTEENTPQPTDFGAIWDNLSPERLVDDRTEEVNQFFATWFEQNNFSLTTQRNYLQLYYEMWLWKFQNLLQLPFDEDYKKLPYSAGNRSFKQLTNNRARSQELVQIHRQAFVLFDNLNKLEAKIQEAKSKRQVSEKKQEQQVSTSVVKDIIKKMRDGGHTEEALIMEILMTYPYRAEVGSLIHMSVRDFNALVKAVGGKDKLKDNYLVTGSRGVMFISRSDYKTFVNYGTIENKIDSPPLKKAILKYLKDAGIGSGERVFPSMKSNQDVSKKLNYLTKKYGGISLGPAALVKIMLSSTPFKDLVDAADFLKEMSRIRGTSLSTLQDVYLHSKPLED